MKDIGKNIRHFRTAKNVTQDELAEKLFVTRQTVSNYETGKSRPDVDMLVRIAEVLDTDIHQIIYGPTPKTVDTEKIRLIAGATLTLLLGLAYLLLYPHARRIFVSTYCGGYFYLLMLVLRPVLMLSLGWTLAQVTAMALKKHPLSRVAATYLRRILAVLLILWLVLTLWWCIAVAVNDVLFDTGIRGEWIEVESNGIPVPAWSKLHPPIPSWLDWLYGHILFRLEAEYYTCFLIPGILLWVLGFPKSKEIPKRES